MNIEKLTIAEAREIANLVSGAQSSSHSFQIGQAVLIRGVTLYYTGRVAAVTDSDVVLDEAAWVASTGRFAEALKTGKLDEIEPYPGRCVVSRAAIMDWCEWPHELPREVK